MEKLKREREGHRDSVKMKRLAGVWRLAQEGQRVEVGAGRPMCGGGMWRCGAVREEEAAELKKRKEKIERKSWRRGQLN